MPQEIKLWRIESDRPVPVDRARLNLEDRLEDWLCDDIALLSEDLLVIGRQINFGGPTLDLLAIDPQGNLVVIELKRHKTPREVVAQALDYAALVQPLGREEVEMYAQDHLNRPLEEAFRETFEEPLPDAINLRQRMYVVASTLDEATIRIVEYLSTHHGVDISAAAFAYFSPSNEEYVARSMLLDADRPPPQSKQRPLATESELREQAMEHGVGELWNTAVGGLRSVSDYTRFSGSTIFFKLILSKEGELSPAFFPVNALAKMDSQSR